MIKTKQRSVRVFEIDNTQLQECVDFLARHAVLLKEYLIFFMQAPQEELKILCGELGLTYFVPNHSFLASNPTPQAQSTKSLRVVSKPVRSGEEIEHEGDLIICESVHHGARIYASGNLMVFGKCEGRLECGGDYLMLKSIIASPIIFAGQIFSQEMLEKINADSQILKLVVKNGDFITIKDMK